MRDNYPFPLFSIIITHYNQMGFIFTSVNSVLLQNYANIELIITDDCSPYFDVERIKKYIELHKGNNIVNVIYQCNAENVGTVRTLNTAIQSSHGEYVLFFAADDCLYDESVVSNFARELAKLPENEYIVSAQALLMDEELEEEMGKFCDAPLLLSYNELTSQEQFRKLCMNCLYSAGATAWKKSLFVEKGFFDTRYKLIEDATGYIRITRNGNKIYYTDFNALKHRDGGVSHYNKTDLPPHVISYLKDELLMYEREILPYLNRFSISDQQTLMGKYEWVRGKFVGLGLKRAFPSKLKLVLSLKKLYVCRMLWWCSANARRCSDLCLARIRKLIYVFLSFLGVGAVMYFVFNGNWYPNMILYCIGFWAVTALLVFNVVGYLFFGFMNMLRFLQRKRRELLSRVN